MLNLMDNEHIRQKPNIMVVPLVDIVFVSLIFFMTLSIFSQMETEINISVPKAQESKDAARTPGEIIINVNKSGEIVVNQKQLTLDELEVMLKRIAVLFPSQPIIIRADENAFHKYVINVLDMCAKADIWNISFATIKKE